MTTIMSSSSSNNTDNDKPLYSQRLVWMERSPGNWWPALTFDSHGQALSELSTQLSDVVKGHLTLKFIANPTQRVAQYVGTNDFVEISTSTLTRHFSDYIAKFYTAPRQEELAPAMKIIKQWLAEDVETTGGYQASTTSSNIGVQDAWSVVWNRLRQVGWKKKYTKSGNVCWVFPGASRSSGIHGQDYFNTLQELQEYIRQEYNWKGSSSSTAVAVVQEAAKKNKRSRAPDKTTTTKRIWGRPPKQQQVVVSTPQNQATCPQDPAKPLLSSSEEEQGRDYTWRPLWDSLKKEGWTVIRAGRYNILHDWYYVRPHASVDTGTMGVDYFCNQSEVTDFVRAQDDEEDDYGSITQEIGMPSPRKRSRKVRVQEEFATSTTTSITTASSNKTTTSSKSTAVVPKKTKPPMKKWWFHTEALPSFRQVWNILHTKLDFKYVGGCYRLPFGDETFACDLDMRCHLLQHGIPNADCLDQEDTTLLTRWITFAHVPVKDTNSIVKLQNLQELTMKQALGLLQKLKFVQDASDGSVYRGENETFASLQEARVYIRASSSLAPPVQGRRARGTKFEISLSPEQVLELRLWAALSRTPLPTFQSDEMEQEDATSPVVMANGGAAMEQEQDESAGNVAASKKNSLVVFESDDEDADDDYVPPSFSGLASSTRVSMSPSVFDYQPLTQQE